MRSRLGVATLRGLFYLQYIVADRMQE